MARGHTLTHRLLIYTSLAVGVCAYGASDICCDRLTAALSSAKVFTPLVPKYTIENIKYWSSTCVLKPTCVFVPESPSDVSTAIKILVENNCEFATRGGGHTPNPG
ncbi:hypothetical protein RSOLAG1IB_07340 [Rhizoctonia solani AG-1 IB]|uniref:FAD linked oxidase N-terminal domain-containing protein n=1 Tax=Thanatephorus cucumeris (strain AG1-IB / isolate 7/3/14) TaxID=1108050 RepID=A0A0B7F9Q6_THACB|nr:hypothetical protein RSOLAG1IB_07340 [Rhizoctonia solani AG-1 IB]